MHGARAPGFSFLSSYFKWKWGLEGGGGGRRGEDGGEEGGRGGRVGDVDWPTPSEVKIARVG